MTMFAIKLSELLKPYLPDQGLINEN